MATGKVKWFDETKGYGFIQPDEGGKDVFVHVSALKELRVTGLDEGQGVAFDVGTDKRSGKPCAMNLELL